MPRNPRPTRAAALGCALALTCLATASAPRPANADEPHVWRLLVETPTFPPELHLPIGVWDPARQRVLAFDGGKIHVFDPSPVPHWWVMSTAGTTPGPYLLALVHDPTRDRLLVLGSVPGFESNGFHVWSLSLSGTPTWSSVTTNGTPPDGRVGHSAIYDVAHDRVVVFAGQWNDFRSDVWALSLSTNTWEALLPNGAGPAGREGHGAIFDPVGQRMVVFGGHDETAGRRFWNDCWELSLGATVAWSQIQPSGEIPDARSSFGTIHDPTRHRMLVHGGIRSNSGIDPDELWALELDGVPTWTRIATENTLRGRSYPVDVYDPLHDRLLACGGGSYPQTHELTLSNPIRWNAVLPPRPIASPSERVAHTVVHDTRRDRFMVMGGRFSTADVAHWTFDPDAVQPWRASDAPAPPGFPNVPVATVYDSLTDRVIFCDWGTSYSMLADGAQTWTELAPPPEFEEPFTLGLESGVALDTRRHRLVASGGLVAAGHAAWGSVKGVWALSLGDSPAWQRIGDLPQEYGSSGHSQFYDPLRDRLVLLGGQWNGGKFQYQRDYGPTVWTTPLEAELQWTDRTSTSGTPPPAPPADRAAFDWRSNRLFIFSGTTVWTRGVDDTGPWTAVEFSTSRPTVENAVVYDAVREQILALFASSPGSEAVQAWAFAVGPISVSPVGAQRSSSSIELDWRSVSAYGRAATVERREESADWATLGPITFDVRGDAHYTDLSALAGRDYFYRVSVPTAASPYHSQQVFLPDPGNLRLALIGAQPNPAVGEFHLAFSLPATGPAQVELYDIHGRRCLSQEVGERGPGAHTIALRRSASMRPGVYLARLQRAGESRFMRVVLM